MMTLRWMSVSVSKPQLEYAQQKQGGKSKDLGFILMVLRTRTDPPTP